MADTAAKSALSLPIINMKFPAGELFPQVSKFCLNEWQEMWDCCEGNKLHSVYLTVGSVAHSKNMSRYDSVLINRLHIGHSRLTHTFCVAMIHLRVNCVDFLFPWDTSWSNVSVYGTFVQDILQSLLLRSCFKVSTIVLLLILLKKPIFITNCNIYYSSFILAL